MVTGYRSDYTIKVFFLHIMCISSKYCIGSGISHGLKGPSNSSNEPKTNFVVFYRSP